MILRVIQVLKSFSRTDPECLAFRDIMILLTSAGLPYNMVGYSILYWGYMSPEFFSRV